MELKYAEAVIRYCPNLTDPDAYSLPVATLVIAETATGYHGATAGWPSSEIAGINPMSASMLSDLPDLLKRHTREAFESSQSDVNLDYVLIELQHGLRNSLHVEEMELTRTVDIGNTDDPGEWLLNRVVNLLHEKTQAETRPDIPPLRGRRPRRAPEIRVTPGRTFWNQEPLVAATG